MLIKVPQQPPNQGSHSPHFMGKLRYKEDKRRARATWQVSGSTENKSLQSPGSQTSHYSTFLVERSEPLLTPAQELCHVERINTQIAPHVQFSGQAQSMRTKGPVNLPRPRARQHPSCADRWGSESVICQHPPARRVANTPAPTRFVPHPLPQVGFISHTKGKRLPQQGGGSGPACKPAGRGQVPHPP